MLLAGKDTCTGCGACTSICPYNAASMVQDEEGFYYPVIDDAQCTNCGACKNVCHVYKDHKDIFSVSSFYACQSNHQETVKTSSSGGMFTELAKVVLENEGVVFGAAFSEDFRALNHCSTDEVPLEKLKKSKYFESNMDLTIKKIGIELKKGRTVLFCGTPCQAMGVRAAFGNSFENLIIIDFLCHGVPSVKAYRKYIEDIERKYKKKVQEVSFRSKKLGWKTYCMFIKFVGGKVYLKTGFEDPFFRLFFSKKALRDCCYSCNKANKSEADITIGDFWGISQMKTLSDNDKGISLVSVHTPKGNELLKNISSKVTKINLSSENVLYAYNRPARCRPDNRINFDEFDFFNNTVFSKLSFRLKLRTFCLRHVFLEKMVRKISRIVKR